MALNYEAPGYNWDGKEVDPRAFARSIRLGMAAKAAAATWGTAEAAATPGRFLPDDAVLADNPDVLLGLE